MNFIIARRFEYSLPDFGAQEYSKQIDPYWIYLKGSKFYDVGMEMACLYRLLALISTSSVKSVTEHFAGLGILARMIDCMFNPNNHILRDIDPSCLAVLTQNHSMCCKIQSRNFYDCQQEPEPDISIMDFPRMTIKGLNLPNVAKAVEFVCQAQMVIYTDSAISKLHMNLERYKVSSWTGYRGLIEAYFENLGLKLRASTRFHNAAYFLFEKHYSGLSTDEVIPLKDKNFFVKRELE